MSRVPAIRIAALALAAALVGGCQTSRIAQVEQQFPSDYRLRHPIMVGPNGAYVASPCGQWPHDLGPADAVLDAMNKPHWNQGCATQNNLAAMVANPNDLLTPRAETPADAARRQTTIGRWRRGDSPGPHLVHQPMQPLTDIKSAVRGGS